jgi:aspartate kinase
VKLVVQKFGGSSVADPERMRRCAERVMEAKRRGRDVVVVVSAMGDTTDDLIELMNKVSPTPPKREVDQLLATGEQVSIALMAMTLCTMGVPAVSLTGGQVGIVTEPMHTRAKIKTVSRGRMEKELAAGKVPVVAGFQGLADGTGSDGRVGGECIADTTTLGRGGSDTTAVALAAALGAEECEIYTDVDGIYTADPRIVPTARLKETISYDEMMEAASQGAKVMHLRAVELGKKSGVPIRVLHSQRAPSGEGVQRGTLITVEDPSMMEGRAVSVVSLKTDIGRVTLINLPNRPGVQEAIFGPIAAAGISVDDIIQNEIEVPAPSAEHIGGRCNIAFTVDRPDLSEVRPIVEKIVRDLGGGQVQVDTSLVKVSAVGVGMVSQSGVAATMFKALASENIPITNITTSEIKISCLIPETHGKRAVQVVHDAFGLASVEARVSAAGAAHRAV